MSSSRTLHSRRQIPSEPRSSTPSVGKALLPSSWTIHPGMAFLSPFVRELAGDRPPAQHLAHALRRHGVWESTGGAAQYLLGLDQRPSHLRTLSCHGFAIRQKIQDDFKIELFSMVELLDTDESHDDEAEFIHGVDVTRLIANISYNLQPIYCILAQKQQRLHGLFIHCSVCCLDKLMLSDVSIRIDKH